MRGILPQLPVEIYGMDMDKFFSIYHSNSLFINHSKFQYCMVRFSESFAKYKSNPETGLRGLEGSGRLRLQDF
jgi:hypothetical protein